MKFQSGTDLTLEIADIDNPGTYLAVGAFTRNDLSVSGNGFRDISHSGSLGWREYLPGTGDSSMLVSGSGYFDSADVHQRILKLSCDRMSARWRVTLPGLSVFEADFLVGELRMVGPHDDVLTFSLTLQSTGPVDVTPIAA